MQKSVKTRVALVALATEKEPWVSIQREAQFPLFMAQANKAVEPFWVYGREAKNHELPVLRKIEKKLKKDKYWQFLAALTGFRPITRKPSGISEDLLLMIGPYDESKIVRVGQKIYLDIPDSLATLGLKTLWIMQYLVSTNSFTHLLRSNTSSFFDFAKIPSIITSLENKDFAGFNISMGNMVIASGAGVVLSRSRVCEILSHAEKWNHSYIDDQALGVLSHELGFRRPSHLPRYDFHLENCVNNEVENAFIQAPETFHWRCKSLDPEIEIQRMKEISNYISKPSL